MSLNLFSVKYKLSDPKKIPNLTHYKRNYPKKEFCDQKCFLGSDSSILTHWSKTF